MNHNFQEAQRSRGVTLVELLVSIVIGVILVFGAVQVYVDSKRTYDVNESVARLQETARYAMSVIEPDVRLAGYFGLLKGTGFVDVSSDANMPAGCGTDFLVPEQSLVGSNASYDLDCDAYESGAVATSDGITVRRASATPTTETGGRLLVCASRMAGLVVESADDANCPDESISSMHSYVVNHYYIARESSAGNEQPSLRRRELIAGPDTRDTEIIPGVEDMQIQFGISDSLTDAAATHYVEPDEAISGQVVSVRIWLLIRSESEEVGFTDDRVYRYGSRTEDAETDDLNDATSVTAGYAPNDGFRRMLVSRTIQIRNAMGS